MPENFSNVVMMVFYFGVGLLVILGLFRKILWNRFAPIKTVQAVVVDKRPVETFSKYAGNGVRRRFVVVFLIGEKKKSFYVSPFSYDGYRLHDRGTLQYQADRLLDFH